MLNDLGVCGLAWAALIWELLFALQLLFGFSFEADATFLNFLMEVEIDEIKENRTYKLYVRVLKLKSGFFKEPSQRSVNRHPMSA